MNKTTIITGASSGIGLAMARQRLASGYRVVAVSRQASECTALSSAATSAPGSLVTVDTDLTDRRARQDIEACLASLPAPPNELIHCAGMLHDPAWPALPEKRLEQVSMEAAQASFALNAIAPMLLAQTVLPRMDRRAGGCFACLSARVGSIEDNRLGGWYSYRASKAALNQFMRTLAIETARRWPAVRVLLLHPGTTDTPLSTPFQSRVPADQLFSPEQAASALLGIIDRSGMDDHGRFIAWDGRDIPW